MATMNFSIPDDIKDRFNEIFEGRNKSALVADLLLQAVEAEQRRRADLALVERTRSFHARNARTYTSAEVRAAREAGRQ
jgi:hypothetical protein